MAEKTTKSATQTSSSQETTSAAATPASTALAQAEEGRLRGISRSIIIGVGGTGHQILLDIRRRLIEKHGSLDKIPIVSFMLLDTDQAIFSRNPDYDDAVNLDSADKIHTSVHGVDALRRNLKDHPHLRTWVDPRVLTGDIDQGAGAVRARGRLSYFWNYATIARKLEDEMLKVTRDSSKEAAIRNGLQVGEGITVYIVGSLLGGTGSGMFLDLAYTVRNKFKSQRMLEMVGMFSIPPNSEAVAVDNRPNAYAALLELNHFTDPSTTYTAQYQADIPPLEDADPPFRYCYLVDTASPLAQLDSVRDLVQMIGHSIFLDLTSEFQRQKKSNRNNFDQFLITSDGLGCPQNYMGFGLSAINFPKDKVIAACQNRLAGDIVRRWTDPLERVVNLGAFGDQEIARLGLTTEAIERQVSMSDSETGETLRDAAIAYWGNVNRQYESAYPGHNRVAEFLVARQKETESKVSDTDPNPDILAKRKSNLGESFYKIQQNLAATIHAKDQAIRDWAAERINDPNHRHGTAIGTLDIMVDRFRAYITAQEKRQEEIANARPLLVQNRDAALRDINRLAGDVILGLIPTAKRREIDEHKDAYITAVRRLDGNAVDFRTAEASIVFYRNLLATVTALKSEIDRYVERLEALRALFAKAERHAIQQPTELNGEILFEPGRREVDAASGQERYVGGDIDDRYKTYVGNAMDPNNAVVNNLIKDILSTLGTQSDIWGVRDGDIPRMSSVILQHTFAIFRPIEEENVLDKFYTKYGSDTDRTIQTLRRVISLSQPFLQLQENAPNYTHNINKEQTIVGVMHGATPRTEHEQRFLTMIMDTVQGVKDQQISNSNEPYQVLFLRERAAFPLRLLQGMDSYRYAYDQTKSLGAAANPIHTRTDVKEWIRISPPSAEEQKSGWRSFVVAWASGVIAEEREWRYTAVGNREVHTFTANYTDKFGMAKSDALGGFNTVETVVAGYKTDVAAAGRPPLEARDIVQRLCDDHRLKAQVDAAIDEQLRNEGARVFGDRLVEHANHQKTELPTELYDAYYSVLTSYLEQINYGGGEEAAAATGKTSRARGAANRAGATAAAPAEPIEAAGAAQPAQRSVKERLTHLKELLDDGLITQREFDARRKKILADA